MSQTNSSPTVVFGHGLYNSNRNQARIHIYTTYTLYMHTAYYIGTKHWALKCILNLCPLPLGQTTTKSSNVCDEEQPRILTKCPLWTSLCTAHLYTPLPTLGGSILQVQKPKTNNMWSLMHPLPSQSLNADHGLGRLLNWWVLVQTRGLEFGSPASYERQTTWHVSVIPGLEADRKVPKGP